MPPRDPKPVNRRRTSKLNLDMPEPELAGMLEQCCDLRQRGFTQAGPTGPSISRNCCWKKPKGAQCPAPREARNRA